jgi:hypothetical protein
VSNSTHTDAPVFLLPDNSYRTLQEVRNVMFLMASMIFAATKEEEQIPLQIPRSLLAQCFQQFATQLADSLDATRSVVLTHNNLPRTH